MTTIDDVLQYASLFAKCAIDHVPYAFNEIHELRPTAHLAPKIGLRFENGVCVNSMSTSLYKNRMGNFDLEHVIEFDDIPEFLGHDADFNDDGTGVDELI